MSGMRQDPTDITEQASLAENTQAQRPDQLRILCVSLEETLVMSKERLRGGLPGSEICTGNCLRDHCPAQ